MATSMPSGSSCDVGRGKSYPYRWPPDTMVGGWGIAGSRTGMETAGYFLNRGSVPAGGSMLRNMLHRSKSSLLARCFFK